MAVIVPVVIPPILHHQRRIVAAFRAAGATDPGRATTVEKLAVRGGQALRILLRHGILHDAGDGMLWLDEVAWNAHEARRRRFALRLILGMVTLVSAALLTLWLIQHRP